MTDDRWDIAVVGAGVAGAWLAERLQARRTTSSIVLLERSGRVGGRLRSVAIDGIAHPIELGGMRYLTSHVNVQDVIDEHAIATRPFDVWMGPERSLLRGVIGGGPTDAAAGAGYDLAAEERGRSAFDLASDAFDRIVPGAATLDRPAWLRQRRTATYLGRPLTDWTLFDAVATVRSPEGHRFVLDAFGYDSGIRPHNAGDAIEYLLGGGDPSGEARVPIAGMDSIPRALAAAFVERGGTIRLGADVARLDMDGGDVILVLGDGAVIRARRVILTTPVPALTRLVDASPALGDPAWQRLLDSVEGFPATKLYAWFERPWWRDGPSALRGVRSTTDRAVRKSFYFDDESKAPAAILASYTDGLEVAPIVALADGRSNGEPAPEALWRAVAGDLQAMHPGTQPTAPLGTAFMHWGSDPREIGWTYWRAGSNSDDMITLARQPVAGLPIHVAGETFSRAQAWVEGALQTASAVADLVLAAPS